MIHNTKYALVKLGFLIATVCVLGACTSSPTMPDELLTETQMRIETAEAAQAGRQAPLALRNARDQLADARQALNAEKYIAARRQLEKAMANADYAIIKSRSDTMQQAAEELRQTLEILRTELESAQS